MCPLEDSNGTSTRDNTLVEIIGADGTAIGNVTDSIKINVTNTTGASAVNIQDGGNSITVDGTISATQNGTWNINNVSGTVSLPTGASTSALQTTGNSSLSSIDIKTPALGQATMANSTPVVIASDQSTINVTSLDIAPATQNITALDVGTTPFVGANGQVFYTGTPTTNSSVTFALNSEAIASVQSTILGTGGTLVVEVSYDGGTFWIRPSVYQPGTQIYTNAFTSPFTGLVGTASATHLRVRSTSSWSGTATIKVVRSENNYDTSLIGIVSVANSTAVALAANATFTGTAEDVTDYASITVQIFTDQASAASGFKPQYSVDATNWDDVDTYTIAAMAAGGGKYYSFPPQAKYFRMVYTNGATLQGAFRLQTIFRRSGVKPSSHRIGDTLDDENDAELVKANLVARKTTGVYDNVEMTANKDLKIVDGLRNGGVHGAVSSTTANVAIEAKVGGARLANRKLLVITVQSTGVFYGFDNTVTTANGTPVANNQTLSFSIEPDSTFQVWLVSASTNRNYRILESP